jgi:hypothetical protein
VSAGDGPVGVGLPACTWLGRHCRALPVTLRIAALDEDSPDEQDAIATWLLGHTERIAFGTPYVRGRDLLVEAVIHVPCRHLTGPGTPTGGNGGGPRRKNGETPDAEAEQVRCAAHGFEGALAVVPLVTPPPYRQGDQRFTIVHEGRQQQLDLPPRPPPPRALPVLEAANPCSTAACRTADNTHGAACCRDLTLDVIAPDGASRDLEDLLRARKIPYLCKVTRADASTIECEVISSCGYLEGDGVSCALHDRVRPDGNPAKPMICSEWPDPEEDEGFTGHPGCVFLPVEGISQQTSG